MQAQYGLDLADDEVLARLTWRKLNVLVGGLGPDTALAIELGRRRKSGDVVPDQVLETDDAADAFWRRRAAIGGGPH